MIVHVDRSLRLPESEYFAEPQAKSGIAVHHTTATAPSAIGLLGAAGIGVVIGRSIP